MSETDEDQEFVVASELVEDDRGELRTTYVSAIGSQVEPDEDDLVLGIVRFEYDWLTRNVDRNVKTLAPPEDLLTPYNAVRDSAEDDDNVPDSEDEARRVAWTSVSFRERYLAHLQRTGPQEVITNIREKLNDGRDVWLVCLEANEAFCHRRLLADVIRGREPVEFSEIYESPDVESDKEETKPAFLKDFGGERA